MANVYNRGKFLIGTNILPGGIVLRAMLLTATYTYDPDDNFVVDIDADEIFTDGMNGYVRETLASVTWLEEDSPDNRVVWDAIQADFGSPDSGPTVSDCVIFEQDNGVSDNASADGLICVVTLTNTPTNGQAFSVQFNGASPGTFLRINDDP